ncbi:SP_1767 family glycosyltransferase [Lactobacillus agrestimuris]|uniref:SP_1767 family glycosyltransferase n=1 Tax=Lactobacillus agrestimuris TaxID=2941328 RepID=UPI002043E5AB|nr:SP_1767 family glycosyltransferase [Lactobacillus agrestimuris]
MDKTIALSADYAYIDKVETTIKSVLFHNPHVNIHVINSDIPHEWFVNLNQYLNQFGASVTDDKIDPDMLVDLHPSYDRFKSIAYGRFFIPDLIPEDKVLYLDSDLVVDSNLDDLFKVNLDDKAIYAVKDYHETEQFNSGVMLINNKKWREEHLRKKLVERVKESNVLNGDQTVINVVLKGQIGELDLAYNYQIGFERIAYWNDLRNVLACFESVINPKIIHYVTEDKPFNIVSTSSLREKWWDYHNLQWTNIVNKYTKFEQSKIKKPEFDGEAFLFTHVAETQDIEKLIRQAPNIKFNIAAYTPMAWLLEHLTKYDNVQLYPAIVPSQLNRIINNADIYLDINYGPKEEPVLKRMMLKNTPILAFEATKSNDSDYQNYYTFDNGAINQMIDKMQEFIIKSADNKKENYFDIQVEDIDQSLELILKDNKSAVRFGDGEFDLIRGDSIPYQDYQKELAKRLKQIILKGNHNNVLVCLPDVFNNLNRYEHYAQDFYNSTFFPRNASFLREIESTNNWYGSTFISRPYIDLVDKTKSAQYFDKLKKLWNQKDILIVEGAYTRSGIDNDLFDNANSIERIICPSKNSFEKIDKIEAEIKKYAENRLVLLMLGPTAKVIVDDLQDLPNQLIDLGHIDSEYEWFKMGAKYKVKLKNKHTTEFNFDTDIEAIDDVDYSNEIVARIRG